MATRLIVVSDLHVGSTVGLMPGDGAELDDGGRTMPNRCQGWLWEQWQAFGQVARQGVRKRDRVVGIGNGDLVDRIVKSAQLWSYSDVDVIKAAARVLEPLRSFCRDGFFVVRGTEAHVGRSGALEEGLAMALDATRWPADAVSRSTFYLRLTLDGVRLDVAHHGRAGRLPWTTLNAAGGAAVELALEYLAAHEEPPQLALRSHMHRALDSGANYPVRVVATPCWQLQTAFGHRIAPGRLPDIGGVLVDCDKGAADVRMITYRPSREGAWHGDDGKRAGGRDCDGAGRAAKRGAGDDDGGDHRAAGYGAGSGASGDPTAGECGADA